MSNGFVDQMIVTPGFWTSSRSTQLVPMCERAQRTIGENAVLICADARYPFARERLERELGGAQEYQEFLSQTVEPEGWPAAVVGTDRNSAMAIIRGHDPTTGIDLSSYRLALAPDKFSVVVMHDNRCECVSIDRPS